MEDDVLSTTGENGDNIEKHANGRLSRIYPVDSYEYDASILAISKHHFLKIPLLGQSNPLKTGTDWCGRTSAAMLWNYYALNELQETHPIQTRKQYVTHWDPVATANKGVFCEMDLLFPNRDVAFRLKNGKYAFIPSLEGTYKSKFEPHSLLNWPLSKKNEAENQDAREINHKRIAKARDIVSRPDGIDQCFSGIKKALQDNNPVIFYSGISTTQPSQKGPNGSHIVAICGFCYMPEQDGEQLWLLIADPSGAHKLPTLVRVPKGLELLENGDRAAQQLKNYDAIILKRGLPEMGRAGLYLLRARALLEQKTSRHDITCLLMDYLTSEDKTGGAHFYRNAPTPTNPALVVTNYSANTCFPFQSKPGGRQSPLHYYFSVERGGGGYFPIGSNRAIHGGVHLLPGVPNGKEAEVHCCAPGAVVAARLSRAASSMEKKKNETKEEEEERLSYIEQMHKFRGHNGFVLVRHQLSIDGHSHDLYSLYLHLQPIQADRKHKLDWIDQLRERRYGSVVSLHRDNGPVGTLYWAKEPVENKNVGDEKKARDRCKVIDAEGKAREILLRKGNRQLGFARSCPGYHEAYEGLIQGRVVTFSEPILPVEVGELLGHIRPVPVGDSSIPKPNKEPRTGAGSKIPFGLLHWEIFCPPGPDNAIQSLLDVLRMSAKEQGWKDVAFPQCKENSVSSNNYLELLELERFLGILPAYKDEAEQSTQSSQSQAAPGTGQPNQASPPPPAKSPASVPAPTRTHETPTPGLKALRGYIKSASRQKDSKIAPTSFAKPLETFLKDPSTFTRPNDQKTSVHWKAVGTQPSGGACGNPVEVMLDWKALSPAGEGAPSGNFACSHEVTYPFELLVENEFGIAVDKLELRALGRETLNDDDIRPLYSGTLKLGGLPEKTVLSIRVPVQTEALEVAITNGHAMEIPAGSFSKVYDGKKMELAHLLETTSYRWRNAHLIHLNEWTRVGMQAYFDKLSTLTDTEISRLLDAAWWGHSQAKHYSTSVFETFLAEKGDIENLNPITFIWLIDRLRSFGVPVKITSVERDVKINPPVFWSWVLEPKDKDEGPSRFYVGDECRFIVIGEHHHSGEVTVCAVNTDEQKETKNATTKTVTTKTTDSDSTTRITLANTSYDGNGVFVGTVTTAFWGSWDLRVAHGEQPKSPALTRLTVEQPLPIGRVELVRGKDGTYLGRVLFKDNAPTLISGVLSYEYETTGPADRSLLSRYDWRLDTTGRHVQIRRGMDDWPARAILALVPDSQEVVQVAPSLFFAFEAFRSTFSHEPALLKVAGDGLSATIRSPQSRPNPVLVKKYRQELVCHGCSVEVHDNILTLRARALEPFGWPKSEVKTRVLCRSIKDASFEDDGKGPLPGLSLGLEELKHRWGARKALLVTPGPDRRSAHIVIEKGGTDQEYEDLRNMAIQSMLFANVDAVKSATAGVGVVVAKELENVSRPGIVELTLDPSETFFKLARKAGIDDEHELLVRATLEFRNGTSGSEDGLDASVFVETTDQRRPSDIRVECALLIGGISLPRFGTNVVHEMNGKNIELQVELLGDVQGWKHARPALFIGETKFDGRVEIPHRAADGSRSEPIVRLVVSLPLCRDPIVGRDAIEYEIRATNGNAMFYGERVDVEPYGGSLNTKTRFIEVSEPVLDAKEYALEFHGRIAMFPKGGRLDVVAHWTAKDRARSQKVATTAICDAAGLFSAVCDVRKFVVGREYRFSLRTPKGFCGTRDTIESAKSKPWMRKAPRG